MLRGVPDDLRYAVRALRRNPAVTAAAILSLALGIGANSAIFGIINALMLAPLPVSHPEELAQVTLQKPESQWFSNPLWEAIRDRQDVFSSLFAYGRWRFNLGRGGEAHFVQGYYVSGAFFETLGVRAEMGRVLTPRDDQRGCPGAAVISDGLWRTDYGGNRDIVGRMIAVNGHWLPIVGVAQRGFTGIDVGTSIGVMAPICAEDIIRVHPAHILDTNAMPMASGIYGWLKIIGRLKRSITVTTAATRFTEWAPGILKSTVLPAQWSAENRQRYLGRTFATQPASTGQSDLRKAYAKALGVLMAISGVVLLIACTSLASLLLARAVSREREIGIRIALGARKGRLIWQFLSESLLLTIAGTTLAVPLAKIMVTLLVKFLSVSLSFAADVRVLSFHVGVALLTALLIGSGPALRSARVEPSEAMKAGRLVPVVGGRVITPRNLLVAVQISLTFLLVVVAELMASTFWTLYSTNPGFTPKPVLLTRVDFRNGDQARERPIWQILK